ncbi:hypothetical protein CAPTEDRAFT_206094 [Capitella teleta]|uniref:Uncharacterized protein n=1 Tax=Capitella teleta TaxID=283909 RepID=R7UGX3_CAPTE|nr:hypothetical protein CAPTEDRAFT_206094 [Capitella teleta]|eukprot:ELU03038.1 hypothetical protein CAPTEDRAFT_206094 [Capitella teleta]
MRKAPSTSTTSSKEIYKECLKVNVDKLTSKAVIHLQQSTESDHRIIIREPLFNRRDADGAGNKLDALEASVLQIGQCATITTKIRLWEKVCRASNRKQPSFSKTKVHKIEDKHHETPQDDDEDGDQESVSFHTLSTSSGPQAPHLRPMWFSTTDSSTVHLVEAEIDSSAGCNTIPLYLYKKTIGIGMEPTDVKIKAYGDHSVKTIGSTLLRLRIRNDDFKWVMFASTPSLDDISLRRWATSDFHL